MIRTSLAVIDKIQEVWSVRNEDSKNMFCVFYIKTWNLCFANSFEIWHGVEIGITGIFPHSLDYPSWARCWMEFFLGSSTECLLSLAAHCINHGCSFSASYYFSSLIYIEIWHICMCLSFIYLIIENDGTAGMVIHGYSWRTGANVVAGGTPFVHVVSKTSLLSIYRTLYTTCQRAP